MTDEKIRQIILSNEGFDQRRLVDWSVFRSLRFFGELFSGSGQQLLRSLGAPVTRNGYETHIARLFPDVIAGRFLTPLTANGKYLSTVLELDTPCLQDPGAETGCLALAAACEPTPTPAELYEEAERRHLIHQFVNELAPSRDKDALLRYYGFEHQKPSGDDWTLAEIGEIYGVSLERVRQIIARAALQVSDKIFFFLSSPELRENAF